MPAPLGGDVAEGPVAALPTVALDRVVPVAGAVLLAGLAIGAAEVGIVSCGAPLVSVL